MITFLGDVALIADDLNSEYKPHHPYVFNCEYVIGDKNAYAPTPKKINLSSEQYNFDGIFGKQPAAVCVVNNHIYDYGKHGFESTVSKLESANIGVIAQNPHYLNDRVCVLSYMDLGEDAVFSLNYAEIENVLFNIRQKDFDIRIVVQVHWGIENHPSANEKQKKFGHWLIDHGVDLVIGHHPHCIQPIEQYKGKYICYSLGNALFGNINQPSHFDENGKPQRVYRFKWQSWNRKSLAINYDEVDNSITVDVLYQKKNTLLCKKKNVKPDIFLVKKNTKNTVYTIRKYGLFFFSNFMVDGKLFDIDAIKHEIGRK